MGIFPPPLAITLKELPEILKVTALPTLTPIVNCFAMLIVESPKWGVVKVAPEKSIWVIAVPTEDPSDFNSTPDITLLKLLPSP